MKKIALLFFLSLSSYFAHAQGWASPYIDGTPARVIKKVDVEGSELLDENWSRSTVKNQEGTVFNNVMLKYNALEDVPYFQSKDDGLMAFVKPLFEFKIEDGNYQGIFRSGFPAVGNFKESGFYQVLAEGKATLLKKVYKKIVETREYNSATTVKKITDNIAYYVFYEGKMLPLKRDKTFFINSLDKSEEMKKFFSSEKTDLKKDEGLVKAVNKYNSL